MKIYIVEEENRKNLWGLTGRVNSMACSGHLMESHRVLYISDLSFMAHLKMQGFVFSSYL